MAQTHYYPYGGILTHSTNQGVQKYKYNGKEFDTMHGLNMYDYGARQQDPAVGMFTSMDPLCEKYYNISPYMYCAGNPIKYVDPDGRKVIITGEMTQDVLSQLQVFVGNSITLSLNENNEMQYCYEQDEKGETIKASHHAKTVMDAVDEKNIYTINNNRKFKTDSGKFFIGGAFEGNTVSKNEDGEYIVTAMQTVHSVFLAALDDASGESGKNIGHEFTEMVEGAKISLKNRRSSPEAGAKGSVQKAAHKKATKQSPVNFSKDGNTLIFTSGEKEFYQLNMNF